MKLEFTVPATLPPPALAPAPQESCQRHGFNRLARERWSGPGEVQKAADGFLPRDLAFELDIFAAGAALDRVAVNRGDTKRVTDRRNESCMQSSFFIYR